jgi:anaerobic dimethyl sulfoxide reductase subunit A
MAKGFDMKAVPVTCNKDCVAGCPLLAHIKDGRVTKITNNPLRDPYMVGCVKGFHAPDVLYAKDRLKRPLLRTGSRGSGQFKEISWKEALYRVAERLDHVRRNYGCESVLVFDGSGSCISAVHNTVLLSTRFFSLFGGFTGRSDSYSKAAAVFAQKYLFNTVMVGFDPPTLFHSNLIILWGANISDTRFSARIESIIRKCKRDGVPIIVIDPRRSNTVRRLATQWVPIRPGTDTAMMAAVLWVLLNEEIVNRKFTDKYTTGFEELVSYVEGRTDGIVRDPSWASDICGVPPDTITDFAHTYGSTKPAALLSGWSLQRALGGEETSRFTVALQAATGNIGQIGGSSGGEFWRALPSPHIPQIPVPDTSGFPVIPVYKWPDAIIDGPLGGYPTEIKVIYNCGSNYLNQGSDIRKNIRAFDKVEFVVTQDLFMTPTARHSDIVLPTATFLEREDVTIPADNFLLYSAKAVEPISEAKTDYDIFCALSERLGFGDAFSEGRTAEEWLDALIEDSEIEDVDKFKQTGIFRGDNHMRVGLSDFITDPESHPLPTPSGKIEIRSTAYAQTGFSPIPECRISFPPPGFPLRMITPHSKYRINSQNSNLPWIDALEPKVLVVNREDGADRGLRTGDSVRVFNRVGEVRIQVRLTDDIIKGTICLTQGAWTVMDENGTEIGGATNALTSTTPTLPSQGSRTHSVFVQLEKL